jgi:hypothetical protein
MGTQEEQQAPKQQKEERFDVSFKGPISALPQIAGTMGLGGGAEPESFFGGEEAVNQAEAGGGTEPEQDMFTEEDIAEFAKRNPPPAGMKMPTATMQSAPPGQGPMDIAPAGIEPMGASPAQAATQAAPQEEAPAPAPAPAPVEPTETAEPEKAKSITDAEAYQAAIKPLPKIETKEEWMKTQEKMPWWKKLLSDLKYYDPDDRHAGQKHREAEIDKKYQQHIQPQLMEREEAKRLLEVNKEYSIAEGDEWIELDFFGKKYPVQKKNAGQWSPQVLLEMKDSLDKTNTINPYFHLGGDAPDVNLPGEEGRLYIDTYLKRIEQGLGLSDNDLARLQPKLHESIRKQKQTDALELIRAKGTEDRKSRVPVQTNMSAQRMEWNRTGKAAFVLDEDSGLMTWELSPETQDYINSIHKSLEAPTNKEIRSYVDNLIILELSEMDPDKTGIENDLFLWAKEERKKGFYFRGKRYPGNYEAAKKAVTTDINSDGTLDAGQKRKMRIQSRFWLKKHYKDKYEPQIMPNLPRGKYDESGKWIPAEDRPLDPLRAEDQPPEQERLAPAFRLWNAIKPVYRGSVAGMFIHGNLPFDNEGNPLVPEDWGGDAAPGRPKEVVPYGDFQLAVEEAIAEGGTEEDMRKAYDELGLEIGPPPGQ